MKSSFFSTVTNTVSGGLESITKFVRGVKTGGPGNDVIPGKPGRKSPITKNNRGTVTPTKPTANQG